jgi:hydroxyacylglutathione hydrolase
MSTTVTAVPLSISTAYLLTGTHAVLVDAGGPGDDGRVRAALASHDLQPADLALVVLTHGHTDHTGVLPMLAAAGVPIAVGHGDEELLQRGRNGVLPATGPAGLLMKPLIRRTVVEPARPDVVVHDHLDLRGYGVDADVERVGGHTPGSVVVRAAADVLVGDLVRGGFAAGRIRPGHPLRHYYTEDAPGVRRALDAELHAQPQRLLPGHGGPLAAADVRRRLDRIAPTR